jgi:hypothetical protein
LEIPSLNADFVQYVSYFKLISIFNNIVLALDYIFVLVMHIPIVACFILHIIDIIFYCMD